MRDEESGSRNQDQEPGEASDSEPPSSDDEKEDNVKPQVIEGSKSVLAANPGGVGRDLWRQLKPVAIPTFKGDKGSFPAWKATFMACVDQAPVTKEYKLLQLRSYLSREALTAIVSLGHSAIAYDSVLERLERKFGGERWLFAAQMEKFGHFPVVKTGDSQQLEKLADLLDLTVINLKETGPVLSVLHLLTLSPDSELGDGTL